MSSLETGFIVGTIRLRLQDVNVSCLKVHSGDCGHERTGVAKEVWQLLRLRSPGCRCG